MQQETSGAYHELRTFQSKQIAIVMVAKSNVDEFTPDLGKQSKVTIERKDVHQPTVLIRTYWVFKSNSFPLV